MPSEPEDQVRALRIGGRRIAQRALQEHAEDHAHAERGQTHAESGDARSDELGGGCVHYCSFSAGG